MIKQFATVALAACACLGGEPVELVFKFDAEKPTRYELVQEMDQAQLIQGQRVNTNNKTTMRQTSRLLEAKDDGSVLIENTTDSIRMSITAPGTQLTYDSEVEADKGKLSDPTIASAAGVVGMGVQLHIAPDGTIIDVPNVEELQRVVREMPDPVVRASVGQLMSEDAIRSMNEMNYKLLPASAVEVGDEWSREFAVPVGFGDMVITLDLTLDSIEDGLAGISIKGSFTMPEIKEQGTTVRVSNAGIVGSLRFDMDQGVHEHLDLTTTMKMETLVNGMGDTPVYTLDMTQNVIMNRLGE